MQCCNERVLRSTSVAVTGGNLTITLPNIPVLANGMVIKFCISQSIDYSNPLGTVSIVMNGTTIALKDKLGNPVRISQLRTRKVYVVAFGALEPDFIMLTGIPCSTFQYTIYPGVPTAPPAADNE